MKLLLILLLIGFLLWFLYHGRRKHPDWAALRGVRYAHRGFHAKPAIPENSVPAFRRAVEHGYGAELDVHLTRDGRLAVIHDSTLDRVCGRHGIVEELTAEELSTFRLEGTEEQIPYLEDVLPLFEGKTPLIVEIKTYQGNWRAVTEKTVACLDRFSVQYCMESFDPMVVRWLRQNRPEIIRGLLSQNFLHGSCGLSFPRRFFATALLSVPLIRPDFIAYRYRDRHDLPRVLCCVIFRTQSVYWTITSPSQLKSVEQEGALAIFERFEPATKQSV